MNRSGLFAFAIADLIVLAGTASATTINFSVYANTGNTGPSSDTGTYWNGVSNSSTTSNDVDSHNNSTGVTLTLPSGLTTFTTGPGVLQNYFYTNSTTGTTWTLNNVTPGSYDLYLVGVNGSYVNQYPKQMQYTVSANGVGGTSGANQNYEGANYTSYQIAATNGASGNTVMIPVTVGIGGSTISVVMAPYNLGGNNNEADFNAVQLVSVPEPASLGLLSLGSLGLLARRRRA